MKFPTITSGRDYRVQLQQIRVALTPIANAINVRKLRAVDCLPFFSKKENACDLLGCKNQKHGWGFPIGAETSFIIPSTIAIAVGLVGVALLSSVVNYPLGILCQIIACYSVFWTFKVHRTAINAEFHRKHVSEEGHPEGFNPNSSDGVLLEQLLRMRIIQTEGVVKRTISTLADILPQERVTADIPSSGVAYRDSTLTAAMNPEEREWMTGGAAGLQKFDNYASKKLQDLRRRAEALGKAADGSGRINHLGIGEKLTHAAIENVESKIRDGIDEVLGELGALSLYCSRIVTAHLGRSVADDPSQTRMRIAPETEESATESAEPNSETSPEAAHAKAHE